MKREISVASKFGKDYVEHLIECKFFLKAVQKASRLNKKGIREEFVKSIETKSR